MELKHRQYVNNEARKHRFRSVTRSRRLPLHLAAFIPAFPHHSLIYMGVRDVMHQNAETLQLGTITLGLTLGLKAYLKKIP